MSISGDRIPGTENKKSKAQRWGCASACEGGKGG